VQYQFALFSFITDILNANCLPIKTHCMRQLFTPNHLLRFLYNDTSPTEKLAIQEALTEDAAMNCDFQELLSGYQQLPNVQFRPKATTIQHILRYSERSAVGKEV